MTFHRTIPEKERDSVITMVKKMMSQLSKFKCVNCEGPTVRHATKVGKISNECCACKNENVPYLSCSNCNLAFCITCERKLYNVLENAQKQAMVQLKVMGFGKNILSI
eukprot:UN11245